MASTQVPTTPTKMTTEAIKATPSAPIKSKPKKEEEEMYLEDSDNEEKMCYCGEPAEWCSEKCNKSGIDEVFRKINGRPPSSLEIFDDLFSRWREANAQKKLRGDAPCNCKKVYCTSCVKRK